MKKILLFTFLIMSSWFFAQDDALYATVLVENDVEITIEVSDVDTRCYNWGYHYGVKFNLYSHSISGSDYNLTFNLYFYSQLGTGTHTFGGQYNLSNNNNEILDIIANNNGKEVNGNFPVCEELKLNDIGLEKVKIDYWGTIGSGSDTQYPSTSQTVDFTGNNPLPIELLSFESSVNKNSVTLEWSTASETNNDFFTVERTTDGINYIDIALVEGTGNSVRTKSYKIIDDNLGQNVYYYRLRQTDYDGKSKVYGPISAVVKSSELDINIFPNPVNDGFFHVSFDSEVSGVILIYNTFGSQVYNETFLVRTVLPIQTLSESGVYLVKVILNDGEVFEKKLVVR